MATTNADWYDFVLAAVYTLSAAVTVGIASVQLFDVAWSDPVFNVLDGTQITVATAFSLGALGLTWVTNENDRSVRDLEDVYMYALIGTIVATLLIPLVPAVESFVTSSDFVRSAVVGMMAVGYAAVAYIK